MKIFIFITIFPGKYHKNQSSLEKITLLKEELRSI